MHAVDTNILLYAFDANDTHKQNIARDILQEAFTGKRTLLVTNQILAEFAYVASTKLSPNLSGEDISRFLRSIQTSTNWEIVNYDTEHVVQAAQQEKHFWNSLIAKTLTQKNMTLLTENTKHFKHLGVLTKNPFI